MGERAKTWEWLRPHARQQEYFRDVLTEPKTLVAAGRRSGKTVLCRRKLALMSLQRRQWADPRWLILSPTYLQTSRLWFEPVQQLLPSWAKNDVSITQQRIITSTGTELLFGSMEGVQRFEGLPLDGVVVDEV